jgi:hypothetical protein
LIEPPLPLVQATAKDYLLYLCFTEFFNHPMRSRIRPFKFNVSILIGSTPANILQVIKGYRIDKRYYMKFFLSFLISLIFEVMNLAERLVEKRILRNVTAEEPPLFVIGFWRSGTTLLHSLLCQDKRAGYVTTFQGVFPNLVLTQKNWLKRVTNKFLPKKRPFDGYSMNMDFPQEEDFAMMSLQPRSIYKMFYFPKDYNDIYKKELHFDDLTDSEQKNLKKKYLSLVHKAMKNTGGVRFISKNPCNIFRIKTLLDLYPDARFIFIYRNPYSVVESLYRFANEVLPGSELQHLDGGIPREYFARLYKDALHEYLNVRETIKPGNLIEIRYEDFKKQPIEFIRNIYRQFNMPDLQEALTGMELYLSMNEPDGRQPYLIEPETYDLVNLFAADIITRLEYQITSPLA